MSDLPQIKDAVSQKHCLNAQASADIPPQLDVDEFVREFRTAKKRLLMVELLECMIPGKGERGKSCVSLSVWFFPDRFRQASP